MQKTSVSTRLFFPCGFLCILLCVCAASKSFGQGGIIELRAKDTVVRVAPEAGANVFSIRVADVEFLHQPINLDEIAGVRCGTPVLYPTPNRVKDAQMQFGSAKVTFKANAGRNFIHGARESTPLENRPIHNHRTVEQTHASGQLPGGY